LDNALLNRSISYAIERNRLLKKAQENEERYFLVAMGSHDGLWDWDLNSGQVYFSPRWKLMLGYDEGEIGPGIEEWLGRVHPQEVERVRKELSEHLEGKTGHFASEHRLRDKSGNYRWVLCRGLAVTDRDGKAARIAGSLTDITRHRNMEQQLALRAYYDPLTGLPNRALFMESLSRIYDKLRRRASSLFALLFLDLDRLKFVNDSMGHQAGDQLLIEFAKRLRSCVRPQDLVARMSGDEFTVLLEDLQNRSEAVEVAERIIESLREPFPVGGKKASTTVSIGIAYSDCGKTGPDGLLQAADAAMYQAKIAGKGRYKIFDTHTGLARPG
jgi:diguanylate cyclase (GGDEF)-like protein/PAS domain S-box-containing protein